MGCGIIGRRHFIRSEDQPLFCAEIVVIFLEIAAQSELASDILGDADEAQARIAETETVLGVPAIEKAATGLDRDAADCGAGIHPARIPKSNPGFGVTVRHELDPDAAHIVGQDMILRAGNGVRQIAQAELIETGEEFFLMLSAEQAEHPVIDCLLGLLDGDDELQSKEVLMMKTGLSRDSLR